MRRLHPHPAMRNEHRLREAERLKNVLELAEREGHFAGLEDWQRPEAARRLLCLGPDSRFHVSWTPIYFTISLRNGNQSKFGGWSVVKRR